MRLRVEPDSSRDNVQLGPGDRVESCSGMKMHTSVYNSHCKHATVLKQGKYCENLLQIFNVIQTLLGSRLAKHHVPRNSQFFPLFPKLKQYPR